MIGPRSITLLALAALATLAIAGCQPLPPRTPKAATNTAQDATPVPGAATPTTSGVPVADSGEEDCMAACHLPDPNEHIADGAMPQPASHLDRTTCLNCHTTAAAPALPATHLGRLDPSCTVCHKPPEAK